MVEYYQPTYEAPEELFTFWTYILRYTWWVFIIIAVLLIWYAWLRRKRLQYLDSINYVLLAIDVPEENTKNPKCFEQIFAGLHGIKTTPNFVERYFQGKTQEPFSLEIVGIAGRIRFLIRTPDYYRDLIEAQVYAQYPEAEITEVDDYVQFIPSDYPNDKYDLYGTDFVLTKEDAYPIRTYEAFTDDLAKEDRFIDPMAAITEVLSKLTEGEQIWLQFIIRPVGDEWKESGERLVKKLIGAKAPEHEDIFQKTFVRGIQTAQYALEKGFIGVEEAKVPYKPEPPPSLMQYLSPGEREVVEAIGRNISKIGFEVKLRFIYVAKKDVFSKKHGVNPVKGAIKQFDTINLNGFKEYPRTKTKVEYWFKQRRIAQRQRRIIRAYKLRRMEVGAHPFVFNTEELATVFHFPYITVEAPTIKWTETKKGEPPRDLPLG